VIIGSDALHKQFCQVMKASFNVANMDVLVDMVVFWQQITSEGSSEIELQQITLLAAEVDGRKLGEEELTEFAGAYADDYMEVLEWIALSSIDSVETLPC